MHAFFFTAMVLFISICVILILLILIQKGRGGGLSGAFGGAGGNTAFGTKTGDVLTWATSIVFGVFLALAVTLNLVADKVGQASTTKTPAAIPASPIPTPLPRTSAPPLSLPAAPPISVPSTIPGTMPAQ